jgi:nucleoside-diphosphate-sugar epimerase
VKKIIVTGATGMLGSHICELAIEQGHKVFAVVRKDSQNMENLAVCINNVNLQVIECDMVDYHNLDLKGEKADYFIHTAWAGVSGDARDDVRLQNINVIATYEAAYSASRIGCSTFINSGSNAEYGPYNERKPLAPDTPCNPNSGYGVAKYVAGKYAAIVCGQNGVRYNNIRCFQIFGRRDTPNSFISFLIDTCKQGKKPSLTSCSQVYDIVYVKDAAQAFLKVAENGKNGVCYVLGSGNELTLRHYVETLRDVVNPACELGIGEKEYGSNQSMYLLADISMLINDTGYSPDWPFDKGIRDILIKGK